MAQASGTLPPKTQSTVYRRSTRKAPAVKNAVVAKRLAGESTAKISRDLGIAVNTVRNITNLTDVDRMMEDGRAGAMNRVPAALKTLDVRLEKNSESAALWLLDKCFDNQQPTGNRLASDVTLNQTLNELLHSDPASSNPAETSNPEKLKSSIINDIVIEPAKE
jgi:hypothetical protein